MEDTLILWRLFIGGQALSAYNNQSSPKLLHQLQAKQIRFHFYHRLLVTVCKGVFNGQFYSCFVLSSSHLSVLLNVLCVLTVVWALGFPAVPS